MVTRGLNVFAVMLLAVACGDTQPPIAPSPIPSPAISAPPSASFATRTDAAGRYVLCNVVGPWYGLFAQVSKPGYRDAYVHVNLHPPGSFDVELQRQ